MNRRNFIRNLVSAVCAAAVGGWSLARKASPRRFIRAVGLKRYPGRLRDLSDIGKQGKWSG